MTSTPYPALGGFLSPSAPLRFLGTARQSDGRATRKQNIKNEMIAMPNVTSSINHHPETRRQIMWKPCNDDTGSDNLA